MFCKRAPVLLPFLAAVAMLASSSGQLSAIEFELNKGERICYVGNTLVDRMQHDGWLETLIQATHPEHDISVRNLGFPGDEVKTRPRSESFGSPDEWLTKTQADVVFCFFGYNEALRGESGLDEFKSQLTEMIDGMQSQQYNGHSAPRLVVFSPIAHENLNNPNLPDGRENNKKLELYTAAMQQVCAGKGVRFVDLFHPTQRLYATSTRQKPLTMNGIHLLERGNKALASLIALDLFPETLHEATTNGIIANDAHVERIRQAILDRNYHWFSRYRVVDGYNVFGGRSKLAWHGQSNYDVMQREMEIFDVMTANRDERVWAIARGGDMKVVDDNLPPLLNVKTNKPGPLENEAFPYLSGIEAIEKMTVAEGMQVNLFASEDMFPEIVNPVQMAVDTDSRLFVSVWPSYPHWNPREPRRDRIVCLPDDNGDGVADRCTVFADELNSVTGFEFWGGGMLVAAPPEIWFLKDTDGDDVADYKLRMLQGISSADTHHSANALVIGPDGGLYYSRGIFNVANMETPTKTYRSTQSGVHRFDPRTFEMSFVFPIGPNPHGDVIDQWGYQFANDGTGGTGSYVNIGKGVGNKQWFQQRVRPVSATGILSSSHFPDENQGNFLICNTIGFLGVLQHTVKYDGADITAVEIEPILVSKDENFRPTDIEIGGDGALYVSDWSNVLIGHMQHNMRDPNRDHEHGRIYRVTHKARPLLTPIKMKGQSISDVLKNFYARENSTRYRARLELSGRPTAEVTAAVNQWVDRLDPSKPDDAQALLECLWVFEEHRVQNRDLLAKVFKASGPRVRAAAIRTLGHWPQIDQWEPLLIAAAQDTAPLVRAEAVKAAVSFDGLTSAEVIFEVANQPTDSELDTVIQYARKQINVDRVVQDALDSGRELSQAAQLYVMRNASVDDLLRMKRTEAVYRSILERENATPAQLDNAVSGLAELTQVNKMNLLVELVAERDAKYEPDSLDGIGLVLAAQPADQLASIEGQLKSFATSAQTSIARQIGYAAWMIAENSAQGAFDAASNDKDTLRDALAAISLIPADRYPSDTYQHVRPYISESPNGLKQESAGSSLEQPGIQVDFYAPQPSNAELKTFAKATPRASGVVPEITIDVPQLQTHDGFGLRFSGTIRIDEPGRYSFFTTSDDGSRLYIDGKDVVNNDGDHGMSEKRGRVNLAAGMHEIVVTYFDSGGNDGLVVSWAGPGFQKQPIPASKLFVAGADTIHDVAIRACARIRGHDETLFQDLATAIRKGHSQSSAVHAMLSIPPDRWITTEIRPTAEKLAAYISEIPAELRTGKSALEAMRLTDLLASKLPADEAQRFQSRLADLTVNVIRIGTVPERMIYDKERLAVQAGKPVEFIFTNTDNMPHNFSIVQPGSLEEVGLLAEATARDEDAMARHYVPKTDNVLLASRLLQPNDTQALTFNAPDVPGIYPYVCTYPGHWRRMYGALFVVKDLKQYLADPEQYIVANALPLRDELLKFTQRNTEWTYDELSQSVQMLASDHVHEARQFDVAKSLFTAATCVACHKLNGEGREFGPDLATLDAKKKNPDHILRSLLEPSAEIDEKFQNYSFELSSGKTVAGLIVHESDDDVHVVEDPVVKPEPTILKKSEIDERTKLTTSTMPKGLLSKLSQEEILDLIAYVCAGGDKKHALFAGGHDHHDH